jgi:mono/diheme cytochrome c family protein
MFRISPAILFWGSLAMVATGNLGAAEVDFARDVRPIFREHCYSCHGEDKQKSGLRLDNRRSAFKGGEAHRPDIIAGNAAQSPLLHFVRSDDVEKRMPYQEAPLSPEEIATLKKWIDEGAIWPESANDVTLDDPREHWSYQPLDRAAAPQPEEKSWARGEIDRFILARLEKENLSHAAAADRLSWLRRVTFDLTGLPPTPERVAAFLKDDSADAFEKIVDELLASPRYAERYAQHWLDVVRYADTHGFEVNTERANAWPYRDYVIEAFHQDTPYDQFIREQLAGDALGKDAATGFLVTAAVLLPGQIGKDEESKRLARQDELGEILINTGEAFLGMSVGCARCHDHKFDPISARDYYSMQAFFAGVDYGSRPLHNPDAEKAFAASMAKRVPLDKELAQLVPVANSGQQRPAVNVVENIERFEPVKARRVRMTVLATCTDNKREPCIDELEVFDTDGKNVALASSGAVAKASGSKTAADRHELRFVNDGQFGNSRSWMGKEIGKGWLEITLQGDHVIDRVVWGRDRLGKFGDRLAVEYRIDISAADSGDDWITVADSEDRKPFTNGFKDAAVDLAALSEEARERAEKLTAERRKIETEQMQYGDGMMPIYAGKFKDPEPMFVLHRGDPEQPKDEVSPAVPAIFGELALDNRASDQQRRLALGEWIADAENPLTARVMVNRIWQWHFGIGLVETANDFGEIGVEPSHPELLDWLATEFTRSGWSMKHMHRLIVLSSTYRQASQISEEGEARDADVRLLWRFPSRRLEAEAIRDSMLAVSGRLNLKMGGKGYDLFDSRGGTGGFRPITTFKDEGLRRMIYSYKVRMEREAVFGAFDCPDAGQSQPRRRQSTTPIQALNLFNSRFTIEEADAFASRVKGEVGDEASDQVKRVWQLTLNRDPSTDELAEAAALVAEHDLSTLCRVVYNSNEFLFLP